MSEGIAATGRERLLGWLVAAIALHSLGIAAVLLFAPDWGVRLGSFSALQPRFFARQAGAFHVVVAVVYLYEWFRYRGVTLLLITKCIAVLFLVTAPWFEPVPWPIPVSAAGDAVMAALVWTLRRGVRGSGRA